MESPNKNFRLRPVVFVSLVPLNQSWLLFGSMFFSYHIFGPAPVPKLTEETSLTVPPDDFCRSRTAFRYPPSAARLSNVFKSVSDNDSSVPSSCVSDRKNTLSVSQRGKMS